jgi:hypothetical protein
MIKNCWKLALNATILLQILKGIFTKDTSTMYNKANTRNILT